MDWVSIIREAVNFIEDNMLEDIDSDSVAANQFISSFHLQRVFSVFTGVSISGYIRYRRLSLAGQEVTASDTRIIDAALKYGYESPESFTKAFQKFHGMSPSAAKENANRIRIFNPIYVDVIIKGGFETPQEKPTVNKAKRSKTMSKANYVNVLLGVSNTEEALKFYEKVFGAWERDREVPGEDFINNPIIGMVINDSYFVLHPGEGNGDNMECSIGYESEENLHKAYDLLKQGAGDYGIYSGAQPSPLFAVVLDKYGVKWQLRIEKKSNVSMVFTVADTAEAIEYYQGVFGASEIAGDIPNGTIDDDSVRLMEIFGFQIALYPGDKNESSVWCCLNYESGDDLRKAYDLLIQEGREYEMSTQAHWTSLYASVVDKYGINWQLTVIDSDEVLKERRDKYLK